MKPIKKRILITLSILLGFFLTGFIFYFYSEKNYQKMADQKRMEDLVIIADYIEAYYAVTGYYPLSPESQADQYSVVAIGTPEQTDGLTGFKDVLEFSEEQLEQELSEVLGEEIELPHDPQQYSTNGRPNIYDYKVYNGNYYLKTYLYAENDYAQYNGEHFYTVEIGSAGNCTPCGFRDLWTYRLIREDLVSLYPEN